MPTQLSVFNGALRLLGEERMTDVSANTKPGRELRSAWGDVTQRTFEEYNWNFASERTSLQRLSETPAHSYDYYYAKPDDWLRTIAIRSTADDFGDTILYYVDEGGTDANPKGRIATSESAVYLRYISSGYLTRIGNWPQIFADYVAGLLAQEICPGITGNSTKMESIAAMVRRRKHDAINWDSVQNPPRMTRVGRLVRSRYGSSRSTQGGAQD